MAASARPALGFGGTRHRPATEFRTMVRIKTIRRCSNAMDCVRMMRKKHCSPLSYHFAASAGLATLCDKATWGTRCVSRKRRYRKEIGKRLERRLTHTSLGAFAAWRETSLFYISRKGAKPQRGSDSRFNPSVLCALAAPRDTYFFVWHAKRRHRKEIGETPYPHVPLRLGGLA